MEVRDDKEIKLGSVRYDAIQKAILDLYIVTGNASLSYEIFRRAVSRDGNYKRNAANASTFFKREDNVSYMEDRKLEIYKDGFEKYAETKMLDISDYKKKEDKYYDIENLTPDELRTKNLTELEEIKNSTVDEGLKTQIIKQQTDLMNAKRKEEETQNTDKFIHYYLPYPKCPSCGKDFTSVLKQNKMIKE